MAGAWIMVHCRSLLGALACALWLMPQGGLAAPAAAADFPVSIPHVFGTTEVTKRPLRVVSVSLIGHDFLLSLGVAPVGLRCWYGDDPFGVWPWAREALGAAEPVVMQGEIDIEQVALLEPDLIVGQWSGMSEAEYRLLSAIAPTLAPVAGAGDYGTPWPEMLRRIGLAVGEAPQAEEIVARLEARFADLRAEHPEWQGATATMAWAGAVGAYTSRDLRGQFLTRLGFEIPQEIDDAAQGNQFYVTIPSEDYSALDTDLLIWLDTGGAAATLRDLPLRRTMRAYTEGREVLADPLLSAALSHSSPLSLDYALDRLVPLIEAAVDGDPSTPVGTTVAAGIAP
jgi:iron complex transport system substrate-binding protein